MHFMSGTGEEFSNEIKKKKKRNTTKIRLWMLEKCQMFVGQEVSPNQKRIP